MSSRIVPDAGDGMAPAFLVKHGEPGEVYRCPQHMGADCAMCGGGGFRAICNKTACHEYGCQGSGCSRKPEDMQP
jgi:hypothetical protein